MAVYVTGEIRRCRRAAGFQMQTKRSGWGHSINTPRFGEIRFLFGPRCSALCLKPSSCWRIAQSCEEETHDRILATLLEKGVSAGAGHLRPLFRIINSTWHSMTGSISPSTPSPLNSGTTAFDALWMGVPIVALEGNWNGGRLVSAALKAFDHQDWIAQDEPGVCIHRLFPGSGSGWPQASAQNATLTHGGELTVRRKRHRQVAPGRI